MSEARRQPRICALLAAAIALLVVASELAWIQTDTRLQPVVDEWVEKSLNLADGLASAPLSEAWRHLHWASLGPRLPLYPLLAVLPLWAFDRSVDSILLVNCASLMVLAYATYKLGAKMLDERAGLIATAFVLLNPTTTHLTKLARPHALIISTTALSLLALYGLAFDRPSPRQIWSCTAALLLAFAAHAAGLPTLYAACLVAAALFVRRLDHELNGNGSAQFSLGRRAARVAASPIMRRAAYPAAVLSATAIASWMYAKWSQYQDLIEVVRTRFLPTSPEWYYEATLRPALGTPSLALAVASIAAVVLFPSALQGSAKRGFYFVLASLAGAFAYSHFQTAAKSWNTFAGVVPMVAVLSAVSTVSLRDWLLRTSHVVPAARVAADLVLAVLIVLATFNYLLVNWGSTNPPRWQSAVTGVRTRCTTIDALDCPNPPVTGHWFIRELLSLMVADQRCQVAPCRVAVLGHRQAYFSDEALAYSLVLHFPNESRLRSLRFYPERNLRFQRVEGAAEAAEQQLAHSQFVVILENKFSDRTGMQNEYFAAEQSVSAAIVQAAAAGTGPYTELLRGTLPTGEVLILVSRST